MNNFGEKVSFLWSVAGLIRDTFKRSKYQDVILPLTVLRRIDCVLALAKADCFRVRLDKSRVLPEFAVHYLSSHAARFSVIWNVHGATPKRVNLSGVASILVIAPSLTEQHVIVEFINAPCNRVNLLIDKVLKRIEFLQEYRTALISAAVTGKIDVRNHGP